MYRIGDHVKMIDKCGRSYLDGRIHMLQGFSISTCSTNGTTWDQANWLAGWLDALAEKVLESCNETRT